MTEPAPAVVEFAPLRSEGFEAVTLVQFDADALKVHTGDQTHVFGYIDIAEWPFPAPWRRSMYKLGWRRSSAAVGERYWHSDPQYARIEFFTTPRLTIWMPAEDHLPYGSSPWVQVHRRLGASGFYTWDMT